MNATNEFRAHQVHTRFLYPFLFKPGEEATVAAAARLREFMVPLKEGRLPVWRPLDQPADRVEDKPAENSSEQLTTLYVDELVCPVREFLFPRSGKMGCCYLRVDADIAQHWFRNRLAVRHRNEVIRHVPKY
jgi:hypothetical protein